MQTKDFYHKLTNAEREIALASFDVRINKVPENEFKSEMIKLIGQTHLNCGFKLDENQLLQTIDELCSDLLKYNNTLTFPEIVLAFKNGYKKEYGDFFGLSNATYFGWVNAYTWGEKRLRVKKSIQDAKDNANKEPDKKTPEEIDYIMKDACLRSFDDFRKKVPVVDAGNVKYNYLVRKGLINFTAERKVQIMNYVSERLKTEAVENRQKAESVEKVIGKILPETIVSESRREALIVFYQDLVETETELKDLIETI